MRRMAIIAAVVLGVAACNDQRGPIEPAATVAVTAAEPGARPADISSLGFPRSRHSVTSEFNIMQASGLRPMVSETGQVSGSVDGVGTLGQTGTVLVDKPDGATVRGAYIAATSTGFSNAPLVDGEIQIDGAPVDWDVSEEGPIGNWNHWAEVTDLVSAKLDAAPAGLVSFTISQDRPAISEGVILGVIFNDPNRSGDNTVIFMFGRQSVGGDNFSINLADPIDADDPDLRLTMGLGISFGFQTPAVTNQVNIIEVNGERLTSSAGGQDDTQGTVANGALLTVGGVGDSPTNPPPFAPPTDFDFDDELYDLAPFVNNGDTQIQVFTENPSFDDNIFFAWLDVTGRAAVDSDPPGDPDPEPEVAEACSPGFWSNDGLRNGSWSGTGYDPGQPVTDMFAAAATYPQLASRSLHESLGGGGGPGAAGAARVLLRAAVAAVLNEASFGPAYPAASVGALQDAVNAALESEDRAAMLELATLLDWYNNNLVVDEDGNLVLDEDGNPVVNGSCTLESESTS